MRKHKIVWRSIGFPSQLFERVRKLIVKTGDVSVAEYVRTATTERMKRDEELLEDESDN